MRTMASAGMLVGVVGLVLAACARRPAAPAAADVAAMPNAGDRCGVVRAAAQQRADSALAIPRLLWRPSASDDTLRIAQARQSGVVGQVLVDTAGAPVMRTFRVLAADHEPFGEPASRMLESMRFAVAEESGCSVPAALVIPFVFEIR